MLGQKFRRAELLGRHRSQGALDASSFLRAGVGFTGALSRRRKRSWLFLSKAKNARSRSTSCAFSQAACNMNSERFLPWASAARSMRSRCPWRARRLIRTSRVAAVVVMGIAPCVDGDYTIRYRHCQYSAGPSFRVTALAPAEGASGFGFFIVAAPPRSEEH